MEALNYRIISSLVTISNDPRQYQERGISLAQALLARAVRAEDTSRGGVELETTSPGRN